MPNLATNGYLAVIDLYVQVRSGTSWRRVHSLSKGKDYRFRARVKNTGTRSGHPMYFADPRVTIARRPDMQFYETNRYSIKMIDIGRERGLLPSAT